MKNQDTIKEELLLLKNSIEHESLFTQGGVYLIISLILFDKDEVILTVLGLLFALGCVILVYSSFERKKIINKIERIIETRNIKNKRDKAHHEQ